MARAGGRRAAGKSTLPFPLSPHTSGRRRLYAVDTNQPLYVLYRTNTLCLRHRFHALLIARLISPVCRCNHGDLSRLRCSLAVAHVPCCVRRSLARLQEGLFANLEAKLMNIMSAVGSLDSVPSSSGDAAAQVRRTATAHVPHAPR